MEELSDMHTLYFNFCLNNEINPTDTFSERITDYNSSVQLIGKLLNSE